MAVTDLYDYYTQNGGAYNTWNSPTRLADASAAGISGYTGTTGQNATLLSYLQNKPAASAPASSTALPNANPNSTFQNTVGGLPPLPTSTGTGIPGATGAPSQSLAAYMSANYDPYAATIMGQYDASKSAASAAAASSAQAITDTGNYNLGYQSDMDKATGTRALESGRGFVVNPGQLSLLQEQSTKRIRDLTTQMNDALANNNTQLASSLADLSLKEQSAMTDARTTFLSQYFQGQQEQRSEASFQTPEQQTVMTLASSYPGAGVVAGDSLAQAEAKVQNSAQYKQALQSGAAGIALTGAQTGLAGAQRSLTAAQATTQQAVNGWMGTNGAQVGGDVADLVGGRATDATLQAKYGNLSANGVPIGAYVIAQIESQAAAQGWNAQQSHLGSTAATANAASLGGGGIGGTMTAGSNFLGSFASGIFGSNPLSTPMTSGNTPSLSPFVSPQLGQTTVLNGTTYKFDGTNWEPM